MSEALIHVFDSFINSLNEAICACDGEAPVVKTIGVDNLKIEFEIYVFPHRVLSNKDFLLNDNIYEFGHSSPSLIQRYNDRHFFSEDHQCNLPLARVYITPTPDLVLAQAWQAKLKEIRCKYPLLDKMVQMNRLSFGKSTPRGELQSQYQRLIAFCEAARIDEGGINTLIEFDTSSKNENNDTKEDNGWEKQMRSYFEKQHKNLTQGWCDYANISFPIPTMNIRSFSEMFEKTIDNYQERNIISSLKEFFEQDKSFKEKKENSDKSTHLYQMLTIGSKYINRPGLNSSFKKDFANWYNYIHMETKAATRHIAISTIATLMSALPKSMPTTAIEILDLRMKSMNIHVRNPPDSKELRAQYANLKEKISNLKKQLLRMEKYQTELRDLIVLSEENVSQPIIHNIQQDETKAQDLEKQGLEDDIKHFQSLKNVIIQCYDILNLDEKNFESLFHGVRQQLAEIQLTSPLLRRHKYQIPDLLNEGRDDISTSITSIMSESNKPADTALPVAWD